ncbi:probable E3 ubiquitin-protein ligase RZFP34 isoform X2 [Drosophila erecta]|uniref:probable E3 ubiquitin-protein ligase RZFP34 isoform X2 n=1 Tax=Drosophila erecta TaxID=7220 RepID=UPI000F072667|nr:probable E3 ubiquitin-protein ligase RZFP34 isoform X2 [Drosophila erecta]
MVYVNLMLGLGMVLVSVATAFYLNSRHTLEPRPRCAVCLEEMFYGDMHYMKCGHALHKACFQEFRYVNKNCFVCNKLINANLPGDLCTICFDPLYKSNMSHLICNHALHTKCLKEYVDKGARNCPVCRMELEGTRIS